MVRHRVLITAMVIGLASVVLHLASALSAVQSERHGQATKLIAGWPRQSYVIELEPFDSMGGTRQLEAVRVTWSSVYDASATVSGGFSAGAILELDASIIQIPGGEYTPLTYSRRRADDWLAGHSSHIGPVHATLVAQIEDAGAVWSGPGVVARFTGPAPAVLYARCAAYGAAYGANGSVEYLSAPVPAMVSVEYEWSIVGVQQVQVSERARVRDVRSVDACDVAGDGLTGLEISAGDVDDDQ